MYIEFLRINMFKPNPNDQLTKSHGFRFRLNVDTRSHRGNYVILEFFDSLHLGIVFYLSVLEDMDIMD